MYLFLIKVEDVIYISYLTVGNTSWLNSCFENILLSFSNWQCHVVRLLFLKFISETDFRHHSTYLFLAEFRR